MMGVRRWALLVALVVGVVGAAVEVTSRPAVAQPGGFEMIATMPGSADYVELRDGYAYISADKAFQVVDVTDPKAPRVRSRYEFPEQIWGFRLDGPRAYVGANFFGLGILDISDPADVRLVGSYKSLGQTKIGAVVETTAALIDHMEGLVFVDVTDETAPGPLGSFYLDGYARDVVTRGSMAYAVDSPTGLYIFDLSGPGPWEPVGVLHAPASPQRSLEVFDLPGGETRLLCGVGAGGLQVFDVSDPTAPVKASTYDTPGQAQGVTIVGHLAYVADGEAGLQVIDLSEPSAPRVVAEYPTPRPARDVAVDGSLVLLVVGQSEYEGHEREVLILRQTA